MIQGKRVLLEPITLQDTEKIVQWRNKEFLKEKSIGQDVFTVEMHEKWMQDQVGTGRAKQFIIYNIEDNTPIGATYLKDIDYEKMIAEYGVMIGEELYLGQGLGTETTELMLQYAFKELQLERVMLKVLEGNTRAIASYKKAGFELQDKIENHQINGKNKRILHMIKTRKIIKKQ